MLVAEEERDASEGGARIASCEAREWRRSYGLRPPSMPAARAAAASEARRFAWSMPSKMSPAGRRRHTRSYEALGHSLESAQQLADYDFRRLKKVRCGRSRPLRSGRTDAHGRHQNSSGSSLPIPS
jgi:hypothetical protein